LQIKLFIRKIEYLITIFRGQ